MASLSESWEKRDTNHELFSQCGRGSWPVCQLPRPWEFRCGCTFMHWNFGLLYFSSFILDSSIFCITDSFCLVYSLSFNPSWLNFDITMRDMFIMCRIMFPCFLGFHADGSTFNEMEWARHFFDLLFDASMIPNLVTSWQSSTWAQFHHPRLVKIQIEGADQLDGRVEWHHPSALHTWRGHKWHFINRDPRW